MNPAGKPADVVNLLSSLGAVAVSALVVWRSCVDTQRKAAWHMHVARACSGLALAFGSAGIRAELRARRVVEDAKL
jgi:hypothetical protein